MGKKKILYYTDCPFFAGCENMIANFLNSEELSKEFDIKLIYRYSKQYEEGAKKRIKDMSKCEGVDLITETSQESYVTSDLKLIAFLQKCLWVVVYIINKYYSIVENTKTLQRKFSEYEPDIIHINNGGYPGAISCYSAVFAANKCGVKDIYYVVNNMAVGYSNPFRWLDFFLDCYVKKHVKRFITGSNNAGNHLKSVLSIPSSKHITIRNGINRRQATMSVSEFKMKYDIPENKIIFSTIANLEDRKGHRYLLQAIKELRDENRLQNCYFVLEGKGPMDSFIRNFIDKNQLKNQVSLINVEAIYDLYSATDVTILPSIANEDFPNIIIESMGMGIPVIGTRIAGIPEQIDHCQNGLLISAANVIELKDAILKMNDRQTILSMSALAKLKFDNYYTSSVSINNYINLYTNNLS